MSYPTQLIALLHENKTEEAVQLLLKAVEDEPENPIHYVNLGTLLFQYEQYEEAKQFFLHALSIDGELATAHYGLATVYYETGEFDRAERALRACLALRLEDADVYYLLGMTYLQQNNLLLALPFLQRASELSDEPAYRFQYGLNLAKLKQFKPAKEAFQQVLESEPQHVDALYNLAIIYIHEERIKEGFDLLMKTIELEPEHPLALQALEQFKKDQ